MPKKPFRVWNLGQKTLLFGLLGPSGRYYITQVPGVLTLFWRLAKRPLLRAHEQAPPLNRSRRIGEVLCLRLISKFPHDQDSLCYEADSCVTLLAHERMTGHKLRPNSASTCISAPHPPGLQPPLNLKARSTRTLQASSPQQTQGLPIGSKVLLLCGLYSGSYQVIPKRNYYGAYGYRAV